MPINPLQVTNVWQLLAVLLIVLPGIIGAVMSFKANTNAGNAKLSADLANDHAKVAGANAQKASETSSLMSGKVNEISVQLDGRLSELLETVKKVAFQAGADKELARANLVKDALVQADKDKDKKE